MRSVGSKGIMRDQNIPDSVYLSFVTRKPVFGVCDQVRHKPACAATEISYGLEISAIVSRGIVLSRQR